jgi:hypothetical protein
MNSLAIVTNVALFSASLVFITNDVNACSCVPPRPVLLSPESSIQAPLNTHIRITLPTYLKGNLVFRKHQGADVPFQRFDSPAQRTPHIALVPSKPLDPDTRYEIALVNPEAHPSTFVFGTFVTGKDVDSTAPTNPKITRTVVNAHRSSMMTSCAVSTPWAQIFLNKSEDPGRTDVPILYAVWSATGKNKIDLNGPPTAFVREDGGKLKLGRTSYCDPDEFPLPPTGTVSLAIAAVDSAGNRSAVQRTTLTMSAPVEAQP